LARRARLATWPRRCVVVDNIAVAFDEDLDLAGMRFLDGLDAVVIGIMISST
jgi:hypothetical protein